MMTAAGESIFEYDAVGRLTSWQIGTNSPVGGTYDYDYNGNRTWGGDSAVGSSTYYTNTNRLKAGPAGAYTEDVSGNIVDDGFHTYEYSQRNRLATVDCGATAGYWYDGDGRRVKKQTSAGTTLFFYDPQGRLLEEYDAVLGYRKDYIWLPGTYEPLARVDYGAPVSQPQDTGNCLTMALNEGGESVHLDWSAFAPEGSFALKTGPIGNYLDSTTVCGPASDKSCDADVPTNGSDVWFSAEEVAEPTGEPAESVYYYHADHLGTPLLMTDDAGVVVWQMEQYPFGGMYLFPVNEVENNLRFPGQYWDAETGMAQNYFRDYDERTGRYWEADPIMWGISPYPYVLGNPIGGIDRLGLYFQWVKNIRTPPNLELLSRYFNPASTDIDLAQFGMLDRVQASEWAHDAVRLNRESLKNAALGFAQSLCEGRGGAVSTRMPAGLERRQYDFTRDPVLTSLGLGEFYFYPRCNIQVNCECRTYQFKCSIRTEINDSYRQPLDGIPVPGFKYGMYGSWRSCIGGAGSW
jgi:RHS repeat-associated protein